MRPEDIIAKLGLCELEGFQFKEDLIRQAFTHTSYCAENPVDARSGAYPQSNQRLEFLGDALLGFLIANKLYRDRPGSPEGDLTKTRASLVREESLAAAALTLGLDRFMLLGRGIAANGGARQRSVLADAFEALLGALYLCGASFAALESFVTRALDDSRHLIAEDTGEDYKGLLQEWSQRSPNRSLSYDILEERGPDHQKRFLAAVSLNGGEIARAWGASKQEAQRAAAKLALSDTRVSGK